MKRIFLFWIGLILLNAVIAQTDSGKVYTSLSNQELVQKYAGRGSFDIHRTADTIFVKIREGVHIENTSERKFSGLYRTRYSITYHIFSQKDHDYLANSIAMYAKRCNVNLPFQLSSALFDGVYAGEKFEMMTFQHSIDRNGYFSIKVTSKKEFDFYNIFIWIADELNYVNIDSSGKEMLMFDGVSETFYKYVVDSTSNKGYTILLSEKEKDSINCAHRNDLIQQAGMTDSYSKIVEALAFSTLNLTDIEALFVNIDATGKIGETYYFSRKNNDYIYFDASVFSRLKFPVLIENKKASEYCIRFRSDAIDLAKNNRLLHLLQDTGFSKPIFTFNNKVFLIHSPHDKLYFLCDSGSYMRPYRVGEYHGNTLNRIALFADTIPRSAFYTDLNHDGKPDFVFQNGNQFSFPQKADQDEDGFPRITVFYNIENPDTNRYSQYYFRRGKTFISPVFSQDSAYISSEYQPISEKLDDTRFIYCFTEKGDSIVLGYRHSCTGTYFPRNRKKRSVIIFDGTCNPDGKPHSTEITGNKNSRILMREYNKRMDALLKK
jgi:hypothetical protein